MLACAVMAIRDEKKQQTRQALLEAAIDQVAGGRSFASLSLREVTRDAGVVPASFYRHFRDMDELGLALVDETCQQLRRLIRAARTTQAPGDNMLAASVSTSPLLQPTGPATGTDTVPSGPCSRQWRGFSSAVKIRHW